MQSGSLFIFVFNQQFLSPPMQLENTMQFQEQFAVLQRLFSYFSTAPARAFSAQSLLNQWDSLAQFIYLFIFLRSYVSQQLMFLAEISPRPPTCGRTFWLTTPLTCWLSSSLMIHTSIREHRWPWGTLWPECCHTGSLTFPCTGANTHTGAHNKKSLFIISPHLVIILDEWIENSGFKMCSCVNALTAVS